jgi:hypothetical protein
MVIDGIIAVLYKYVLRLCYPTLLRTLPYPTVHSPTWPWAPLVRGARSHTYSHDNTHFLTLDYCVYGTRFCPKGEREGEVRLNGRWAHAFARGVRKEGRKGKTSENCQ